MKRGRREAALVAEILRVLRALPGVVVRKRHGSAWGVAGDPDLYGSFHGTHFELEIKRPGEKPTALQLARLKQWAASGARVGIATSLEEALRIVGAEGRQG